MDKIVSQAGNTSFKRSNWSLNEEATFAKLKKAANRQAIKIVHKQTCDTIDFSTGAYLAVVMPLLQFWQEIEGDNILPADVDGMDIVVDKIETTADNKGRITGYIARLHVDGQAFTVTLYDTTLSLMVQSGNNHVKR